jgi:hypothetical protein
MTAKHHPSIRISWSGLAMAALLALPAAAQVEHGGHPVAQRRKLESPAPTAQMVPVAQSLAPGVRPALPPTAAGTPRRFGEVLEVDLDLDDGRWEELDGGDRVWRLRISSPGAYSLAFVFRHFSLPEGGELFVHDDTGQVVRGAYTALENRLDGEFAIQPTPGDALTLEYFEPARARGRGDLSLALVVHDTLNVFALPAPGQRSGGGGSGACNIDVACPPGVGWEDQSSSVARLMVLPSGTLCSGSLLNNTSGDGTLLVITAEHCGNLTNAVFTFNYELPSCGAGVAPTTDTLTGATELVVDEALDFRLARINDPAPASYGLRLSGWNRTDVPPASAVGIHHPGGDVKKISVEAQPPVAVGTEWEVHWDAGVTEGGSSGSPLYGADGLYVGQLSRGSSSCAFPGGADFYGRLALQWDLLGPYLDPAGLGSTTIAGLDPATVVAGPFDVTAVVPGQVETLYPGVRKPVRVLGAGFDDTATIAVDGIALTAGSYVRSGNTWLNVDPPELNIGPHTLTVTQAGQSRSVPFDVVAPAGPRFQLSTGEVDAPLITFVGGELYHADQPGHVHYCFWSFSNVPSVHPFLTLALGNAFSQVGACRIQAIPAEGWMKIVHPIPSASFPPGTVVYAQTACVNHGTGLPLPTSELQQGMIIF